MPTKKKTTKKTTKSAAKTTTKKAKKPARKVTITAKGKTIAKTTAKTTSKAKAKARVNVGQAVPAFSLPSTGGKTVSSNMLQGKAVVLYFYPKDATPGCTLEGHDFTRLHDQFKQAGAEVFGVSRDSMKSHEKFKECENYSLDLLSDEDETFCKLFGVIKDKNMYGKVVRGIERSTFVLDRDGRLVKEWRGVKVPGHAEEVLDFVKTV
jgi:peroxiredoxin Q/BCP